LNGPAQSKTETEGAITLRGIWVCGKTLICSCRSVSNVLRVRRVGNAGLPGCHRPDRCPLVGTWSSGHSVLSRKYEPICSARPHTSRQTICFHKLRCLHT